MQILGIQVDLHMRLIESELRMHTDVMSMFQSIFVLLYFDFTNEKIVLILSPS